MRSMPTSQDVLQIFHSSAYFWRRLTIADELTGTTFEKSTTERDRELLARMDRFPAWPLRKSDFFVIGIAYFFVFYDISDIGFAMPAIDEQMNLGQDMSLFVALAVGLVGYIIGSLLAGWLSDAKGRKVSFIGSLVFSGAGSLLCGFSFHGVGSFALALLDRHGRGSSPQPSVHLRRRNRTG